eukprot:586123-Prymnesium_polylepis.3
MTSQNASGHVHVVLEHFSLAMQPLLDEYMRGGALARGVVICRRVRVTPQWAFGRRAVSPCPTATCRGSDRLWRADPRVRGGRHGEPRPGAVRAALRPRAAARRPRLLARRLHPA